MTYRPQKALPPGGVHDAIARGMDQAGGVQGVADLLQLTGRVGRVYDFANPDADRRRNAPLAFAEAAVLSRAGVTALAEHLALASGGVYLPPLPAGGGAVGALAGMAGKEFGEAMAGLFQDLADAVLSQDEATRRLPEVREALNAMSALYRAVERIAAGQGS